MTRTDDPVFGRLVKDFKRPRLVAVDVPIGDLVGDVSLWHGTNATRTSIDEQRRVYLEFCRRFPEMKPAIADAINDEFKIQFGVGPLRDVWNSIANPRLSIPCDPVDLELPKLGLQFTWIRPQHSGGPNITIREWQYFSLQRLLM